MTEHFARKLQYGQQGEDVVKRWLERQGYFITSTSDIHERRSPAPSLTRYVNGERITLPDVLASMHGMSRWVEVKTKTKDVLYQKTGQHKQGIAERLFKDYLIVRNESGIPGFLAFLVLTPPPIKLRIGSLALMEQYYTRGNIDNSPHLFWPIDIFETHELIDDDLVLMTPAPNPPITTHVWEKPAPAVNDQQEYFDFKQEPKNPVA